MFVGMFGADSFINHSELLFLILSVYAQIGLFFCFFLPSGGFMFTAGILIAAGSYQYSMTVVSIWLILAAIAGNLTGYWFGKKTAPFLDKRKDSRFFKQAYLITAKRFFEKYGSIALSAALFFPLIRTFVPIFAGIIKLDLRRFLLFSTIGSIGYVFSFLLTGYLIGSVPALKPYLSYIIFIIILVLTLPILTRIIKGLTAQK